MSVSAESTPPSSTAREPEQRDEAEGVGQNPDVEESREVETKSSAAGTRPATAASSHGRGSPRASHSANASNRSGATHVMLRSSIRSAKRDA